MKSLESPINYWTIYTYPRHLSYEFQALSTWVLTSSSMIQYKDSDMKSMVYAMLIQLLNHSQIDKKSPKNNLTPQTQDVNWTYIRRTWTSYVHSIYVLCGKFYFQVGKLPADLSIKVIIHRLI